MFKLIPKSEYYLSSKATTSVSEDIFILIQLKTNLTKKRIFSEDKLLQNLQQKIKKF